MPLQDNIGPYRLLNLIRSGKSCEVWEMVRDSTGERMAVKLLTGKYATNREEVAFLRHEHAVGHKFQHPQVIEIYEFGSSRGCVYLTMELFAAPNVKQLIHQGVEGFAPVLGECMRKMAQGMAYFHAQGWVHRDIKPDNFLMKPNGDVKLIDFALAVRPKGALGRLFSARTKVQGTRSYMSPEQIRGEPLDQRADIYSFGCMLHELLGGKPPYTGNTTNDLLNKHLHSAIPPVQASNQNVTEGFGQLLKRMLAKKPEDRPSSMDDVLSELRGTPLFKVQPKMTRKLS